MVVGPLPNAERRSIVVVRLGALTAAAAAALVPVLEFSADLGGHHHHGIRSPATSSPSPALQPTFNSEMADINARMHHAMEISPSGDIDRDFMRMMIPHHQGAIEMARELLKYGRDEKLKRLAQSIIVEQAQEIAYMRTLLVAAHVESERAGIADK